MDRSGLMSSFGENLDEMAFMTVISLLGGVTKDQLSLILLLTTFDISRRKPLIKDRAAYFRKKKRSSSVRRRFSCRVPFGGVVADSRTSASFIYGIFYNPATSCATLLSFVHSFITCSVLPLYCTLVLSFAIPSTVIRFLSFMTRGPHRIVN
jgi:hypothetical protein